MKLGTWIRLPDGREATVVYHSLCGTGIKWGLHSPDPKDFEGTDGNLVISEAPPNFRWQPDAMLRNHNEYLEAVLGLTCVGEQYEIIRTEVER